MASRLQPAKQKKKGVYVLYVIIVIYILSININ